jgi:hypothetical protein
MSDLQIIESAVQQAAKRRRLAQALRGLWQGLLIGAFVSLLLFGAYRLLPFVDVVLPFWVLFAVPLIPVVGLLLA